MTFRYATRSPFWYNRIMNKTVVFIPLAFVLGGLVGAWRPSEELRALKARPAEAPQKPQGQAGFDSFAKMVNIPDEARRPRRQSRRPAEEKPSAAQPAAEQQGAEQERQENPERREGRPERPRREMSPEDLRARIDEAAELWRTRVEIARAQTVEKLGLDDAGAAQFDAALENMNAKLRDSIQIIATRLADEEDMTPELGVRLMGDLCTTLAESYDEIGQCVGEDRRGEISGLELHNFVDPSVAEPLISVQGKLGGFRMRGIGGRP